MRRNKESWFILYFHYFGSASVSIRFCVCCFMYSLYLNVVYVCVDPTLNDCKLLVDVFPTIYFLKFLCENEVGIYITLIGSSVYFFVFTFSLVYIWFIQTMNLFLGRTTYERFSNLHNKANKYSPGELLSEYSDKVSISNCSFMCCTRKFPDQEKLKEYQAKCWIRGSTNSNIRTSIFELNAVTYQKTISSYKKNNMGKIAPE